MSRYSGGGRERGAATLLVVTCAGLLLLVGSALGVVSALVVAHRTAQSAADLAALAGAGAAGRGQDGCAVAAGIAHANGSTLASCDQQGVDVTVSVTVPGPSWAGWHADLVGRARAGPADR